MGLDFYLGVITTPLVLIVLGLLSSNRFQIALAYDQLLNTYLWGWADETLSARIWRNRFDKPRWAFALKVINALFFWQLNHCRGAYQREKERAHLPVEYR